MARPTEAKEPENKAKDDKAPAAGGGGNPTIVIIAMALVTILGTSAATAASIYFLAPMVIQPMLQQSLKTVTVKVVHENAEAAEGGEGGGHGGVGPTFRLDEFTVNLKDPNPHYLRAKVSLMLSTHDKTFGTLKGEEAKKWAEEFDMEMQNYKASLNDIVISTLTNQSLADVSSEKGKEKIKETIAKQAQLVLGHEHNVLRVNIEEFIVQ